MEKRLARMMREQEVAEIIGLSVSTLQNWRSKGRSVLPYVKLGRTVRYSEDDVRRYIDDSTVYPGARP